MWYKCAFTDVNIPRHTCTPHRGIDTSTNMSRCAKGGREGERERERESSERRATEDM